MDGITLDIAKAKLQEWLAADSAVAKNQEVWVEGRRITRAQARDIRRNIEFWQGWVMRLQPRRRRVSYVVGG